MTGRYWVYLIFGSLAVISGVILFFGVVIPYATTPERTVAEVQALSSSVLPSLLVGGIGSVISWPVLAGLILSSKNKHVIRKK